jgi:hypothetical protein
MGQKGNKGRIGYKGPLGDKGIDFIGPQGPPGDKKIGPQGPVGFWATGPPGIGIISLFPYV